MTVHRKIEAMTPAPELREVPLTQLRPGRDYPLGNIDIRQAPASAEDDAQLRATLAADGILQSLLVTTCGSDDYLYVIAGNRRLAQVRDVPAILAAPCVIHRELSVAEALALALAEDLPKVPPHPVDRFEAFARIRDEEGLEPGAIAARFGIAELAVKRALKLGAIPGEIRAAWREDRIDGDAAQIFTLARDEKHALKVFRALTKLGALSARAVREHLCPDQGDAAACVEFVGADAFVAAGGRVIANLFGGEPVIAPPELAFELAEKKLDDTAKSFVFDDGWGWAARDTGLPSDWSSWPRVEVPMEPTAEERARLEALEREAESGGYDEAALAIQVVEDAIYLRALTAEDRARSGVVLWQDGGALRRVYGVLRPAAVLRQGSAGQERGERAPARKAEAGKAPKASRKKAAADEAAADGDDAPGLTDQHKAQLGCLLSEAAAQAVLASPERAALILLCGFAASGDIGGNHHPPVRARVTGLGTDALSWSDTDIAANIARWKDLPRGKLDGMLARCAGAALAFNRFAGDAPLDDPAVAALCALLDAKALASAALKRFDAADYFKRAPKDHALRAIAEICGEDEARRVEGRAKDKVVKFALANLPGSGWLPPALRFPGYAGPGAAAPAKSRVTKKAAAKKKPGKRRAAA